VSLGTSFAVATLLPRTGVADEEGARNFPLRRFDLQQPDERRLVFLLERHNVEHAEPASAAEEETPLLA